MAGQVEIMIDTAELEKTQSTIDYFNILTTANVPAIPIVHSIITKYVVPLEDVTPGGCTFESSLFGQPPFCLETLAPAAISDPVALTAELKEKVFDPSVEAQTFVDRFDYLTRLYAEMSPEHMTKDPFFAFDPDLPDVSNNRTAEGVPVCGDDTMDVEMEITVDDDSTIRIPAVKICGIWRRADSIPLFGNGVSPAKAFTVHRYGNEASYQIQRLNGTFVKEDIIAGTAQMDDRVVSQVVSEYVEMSPSETPAVASPTNAPAVSFAIEYRMPCAYLSAFASFMIAFYEW